MRTGGKLRRNFRSTFSVYIFVPARSYYSRAEDMAIVEYIISNAAYSRMRSAAFYNEMAEQNIVPNRSAESLRNRFRQSILPKIEEFGVAPNEITKFVAARESRRRN